MKIRFFFVFLALAFGFDAQATSYNTYLLQAVSWLNKQQNSDGSWGATPDLQPVYTSVAVQALAKAYNTDVNTAYYGGVAWLEDHAINNVDLTSRSAEALLNHGDNQNAALSYLQSSQSEITSSYYGWGLSGNYNCSSLDTALALIALNDLGKSSIPNLQASLNYLKHTQFSVANDQGWTIGYTNTTSDPSVTAIIIQALSRYTGTDSSLSTYITNGLTFLNSALTPTSTFTPSPIQLALAAQAAQDAGDTVKATSFLNYLVTSPSYSSDGSWSEDPYVTAVALRALATAVTASTQNTTVIITDQNLQAAINKALGRNAMDSLNLGLLAQLTTLNAAGYGISNLSGLQNATNLTSINLNNNNLTLTSFNQINNLVSAGAKVTWYDNPGNPSNPPGTQVPGMPPLAMLILAVGLLSLMQYLGRAKLSGQAGHQICLLVLVMVMATGNSEAQTTAPTQTPIPTVTLQELRAKGIPSAQLQTIQKIGGNILQAKRSATVDPNDKALLNQAQATVNNLLNIEKSELGSHAGNQSQLNSARQSAQSAAWNVVTALRQESGLLQGTANKPAQKQILSGGKPVGAQRGNLYANWANQLETILGNHNTPSRFQQLLALNKQLQPVSSITLRIKNPDISNNYHALSRHPVTAANTTPK
jgi:hypothetical protein